MKKKTKNWLEIAESDLGLGEKLIKDSGWRYYSPHFCHQAVEKLLKAIIAEKTTTVPPYIHKLKKLSSVAKIKLTEKQLEFILTLDPLYIGTKYPEELAKIKYLAASCIGILLRYVKNYYMASSPQQATGYSPSCNKKGV